MANYVITADSGCDLSREYCESVGIIPIHMKYLVDGAEYTDNMKHDEVPAFYDVMRGGKMPTTVQLNEYDFNEFWEPMLKDGKDILHICMSSGISGTYSNAVRAAGELMEKYTERKIAVIDSFMTSAGSGMLAIECAKKRDAGVDFSECSEWAKHSAKRVHACFTTDDVTYLYRGGRVSKTGMIFSKALHIFPVLHVDHNGELKAFAKCRGTTSAWNTVAKYIEDNCENPSEQTLYVCDADNQADIVPFAEMMRDKFGFKDIFYSKIGAIIGAHTGPGLLTLFFMGKERTGK